MKKKPSNANTKYLNLLNLDSASAVSEVAKLSSELTGDEHTIRSSIIDMHFAMEQEVKRFLYHSLRGTILFTDSEEREKKAKKLNDAISRMPMGTALNLLEASIKMSPWPDLENIWEINKTRNKLSHRSNINDVFYKGRNPFTDTDCLAQMYFDVWAVMQSISKLFEKAIDMPLTMARHYYKLSQVYREKFGELDPNDIPKLDDYPEW